jgi:hypothetical protein
MAKKYNNTERHIANHANKTEPKPPNHNSSQPKPNNTPMGPRTEPRNYKPASKDRHRSTKERQAKDNKCRKTTSTERQQVQKDNKCQKEEVTDQGCLG